jgi:hypothetical protein
MPNATLRANARTLPEATEPTAVHENWAHMQAFSRAYSRWLKARAQIEAPDSEDEDFVKGICDDEEAAQRELFLFPACCSETVWAKLAVFEDDLIKERIVGEARTSILLFALGSIKADLINLGIGGGDA